MPSLLEIIGISGAVLFFAASWYLWVKAGKKGEFLLLPALSPLVVIAGVLCILGLVVTAISFFQHQTMGGGMDYIYLAALVIGLDQFVRRLRMPKE